MAQSSSELLPGTLFLLILRTLAGGPLHGYAIAKRIKEDRALYNIVQELTTTIRAKLTEAQVPVMLLDGRIKRLYSIHLKLKRQKIDIERVYDFVAIRVITQSVKDCYAALGIIHQTWSPVPGRIKDFIAIPRANRYQSLHTTVIGEGGHQFEVQIRTEEMHRIAEEGVAAHWAYKEGKSAGASSDEHIASENRPTRCRRNSRMCAAPPSNRPRSSASVRT